MIKYFLQGFLLGFAYVAPIGMQNMYIINTAATRSKLESYKVAAITIFFDISLAIACFFGIGILIDKFEILKDVIMAVGSLAVIFIGVNLIRDNPEMKTDIDTSRTTLQVIGSCFAVTWLNPQALIDGSLLLGGFKASLPEMASYVFIAGVCIASMTWFTSITTIVSKLKKVISNNDLKWINIVCGLVIVIYGLRLGVKFVQNFI